MEIVLIEDEKLTAKDLATTILSVEPDTQIIASLGSVKEAINYFKKDIHVDLIFSDIQLGDGLSFEVFKEVHVNAPVIFCTAYDEYALNAFKTNGIDYILKPFNSKTIEEAFSKYRNLRKSLIDNTLQYDNIAKILVNNISGQKTSLLVHYQDKILPVRIDDIAVFYLKYEVTHFLTFDRRSLSIEKNLEELEQIIGNSFFRVNRQCLVNRKAIAHASRYFSRKLSLNLVLPFKEPITISKEKTPQFLEWLSGS